MPISLSMIFWGVVIVLDGLALVAVVWTKVLLVIAGAPGWKSSPCLALSTYAIIAMGIPVYQSTPYQFKHFVTIAVALSVVCFWISAFAFRFQNGIDE